MIFHRINLTHAKQQLNKINQIDEENRQTPLTGQD
jgi:hypothetical protein